MLAVDQFSSAAAGVSDLERYAWALILVIAVVAVGLACLIVVKGGRRG